MQENKMMDGYSGLSNEEKLEFDKIIALPDVVLPTFPVDALAPVVKDYCLEVAESTQ